MIRQIDKVNIVVKGGARFKMDNDDFLVLQEDQKVQKAIKWIQN
ncbi:MAG: hypothetical protein AAF843_03760 [Bacteroidota bacterium]